MNDRREYMKHDWRRMRAGRHCNSNCKYDLRSSVLNVSRNLLSAAAKNAGIISADSPNCKPNVYAAFAMIDQAASLLHHRRRFTEAQTL